MAKSPLSGGKTRRHIGPQRKPFGSQRSKDALASTRKIDNRPNPAVDIHTPHISNVHKALHKRASEVSSSSRLKKGASEYLKDKRTSSTVRKKQVAGAAVATAVVGAGVSKTIKRRRAEKEAEKTIASTLTHKQYTTLKKKEARRRRTSMIGGAAVATGAIAYGTRHSWRGIK